MYNAVVASRLGPTLIRFAHRQLVRGAGERDMNILTFSEARAGFKQALDAVCRDHEPTVITRQRGEHVVMISLDDYNSMQETLHLLGTPANSDRLRQSIAEFRAGKTLIKDLATDVTAEENKKQSRSRK